MPPVVFSPTAGFLFSSRPQRPASVKQNSGLLRGLSWFRKRIEEIQVPSFTCFVVLVFVFFFFSQFICGHGPLPKKSRTSMTPSKSCFVMPTALFERAKDLSGDPQLLLIGADGPPAPYQILFFSRQTRPAGKRGFFRSQKLEHR